MPADALIVVDVQNDFCPGGALPVPEGDRVVPVLNEYIRKMQSAGGLVLASRDWHPAKTSHFKEYGGLWPPHCIQGTRGAAFHPDLRLPQDVPTVSLVSKGMEPEQADAYSAFQAVTPAGIPLADALRRQGVTHVYVGGLATDYCVKATVLDALQAGFAVTLLLDASRGVNVRPHDSEEAIEAMVRAGADCATLERIAVGRAEVAHT
jgi:nicotinamidase/pyrazinamidase